MRSFKHLFGPVPSRRFGRSLGVDLIPPKTCSTDCLFCQVGNTTCLTVERREYVPMDDVLRELGEWLDRGDGADFVTLAGSGEPTLHARFGEVPRFIRARSAIQTLLLSNGTLFWQSDVREQAQPFHVVKTSLSAWDQTSFELVNRPCPGLRFEEIVAGQAAFREQYRGRLLIEVFIVPGLNAAPRDVRRIAEHVRRIAPDGVQLNTAVRPPAERSVKPLSRERLEELALLFEPKAEVIAEFTRAVETATGIDEEDILAMLDRRPCTAAQIAAAFGLHVNEVSKLTGHLTRTGRARLERRGNDDYFVPARARDSEGR